MSNRIGRVHKLGKQNIKRPDMITNILTVPVSTSFYYNTYGKSIDMKLNLSYNNTMSSTTTSAAHEKPADII